VFFTDISRHKTDYWIKNDRVDVSIKDIIGPVTVHWHEFYEIELILEGGGTYHIDGVDYPIERGALFVMSQSSFHRPHFSANTRLVNFMFTLEACDPSFLYGVLDRSPHARLLLDGDDVDFIYLLAREMTRVDRVEHLTAMLNCVLGKIQRLYRSAPDAPQNAAMLRAILYIQNHFRESLPLARVAEIAGYTPNYFSNKFKKETGRTFKHYIADLQFSLAENMLRHTDLSVSEICYHCGFGDFSNFMTYFKRRHGIPPKEYRRLAAPSGER
jgi:AraC-like DNA-binding protein